MRMFPDLCLFVLASCGGPSELSSPPRVAERAKAPEASVAAERTPEDRALDEGRKPAEMIAFFGVGPGQRVLDVAAGGGYTTEILARAVGPSGHVWSQNSQWIVDRFAKQPWSERLAKPVNKNVTAVVREMDDPIPDDVKDLDAVVIVLFYHDLVWQKADRGKLNARVFQALKKGGVYGVVDHSAAQGHGLGDVQTLHRIEESVVRAEIEKAGFKLAASGDFLRHPEDARDWNDNPREAGERRGKSDRFVLKFVKP